MGAKDLNERKNTMYKLTIIILTFTLFACDNPGNQLKIKGIDNNRPIENTPESDTIEGYKPSQPINFSHSIHAAEKEIDCKYCHKQTSSKEHITPSHSVCLDCHKINSGDLSSGSDRELIKQISDSIEGQKNRIVWRKIRSLPDSVYFSSQFK